MEPDKLKSAIESILFIAGEPVEISRIAKITDATKPEVEAAIVVLQGEYATGRGMVIVRKEEAVQMATAPDNAEVVSEMVKSGIQDGLSKAALEVLSIVAYRGPISRVNIEAIRGVNCSFTLRALLLRGLLERMDDPKNGRSYLYKISFDFLKKMGLENVEKLPDFETLSQDSRIESIIES
ncbi:MAG: SMC-Scp complex subunit ScpB [Parcubacteria group bacterium]